MDVRTNEDEIRVGIQVSEEVALNRGIEAHAEDFAVSRVYEDVRRRWKCPREMGQWGRVGHVSAGK